MSTPVKLCAAMLLVTSVAFAAPKKKKKAPDPTPAAAALISAVLDGAQGKVGECVLASAPQGAWTLNVDVKVMINGAGQVMSAGVKLDPERGGATMECIDKAVRAAPYPKTAAPLINISRTWTFSLQG